MNCPKCTKELKDLGVFFQCKYCKCFWTYDYLISLSNRGNKMMNEEGFINIFGNNPHNKILWFFINNNESDYCISDIAKFSNTSRNSVYKFLKTFKKSFIKKTRKHMFKADNTHPHFKLFCELCNYKKI